MHPGKQKLDELVAGFQGDGLELVTVDRAYVRSISDAYKAMEAENERLKAAARAVCWFDWSDNDDDACEAIESLRTAVKGVSRHEG